MSFSLMAMTATWPLTWYLRDVNTRWVARVEDGFVSVARVDDVPPGTIRSVQAGDEEVALAHFFTGGASPVATRQSWDAARRAAIVATAARPA